MLSYYLNLVETQEDKNKVEKLYHKYRKLMKYIALKMLQNEDMAEDAVSDAMVSLIENLDRIDDVEINDTKSFVYIVIRNVCLNKYNKAKKQATLNLDDFAEYRIDERDVFDVVYLNDLFDQINNLPSNYKDVLELKTYYGMSTQEIADLLHLSNATVRKRLERARTILKKSLKREENHV